MKNVIIANALVLAEKIKKFSEGGLDTIQVVSDFDKTLTKFKINGEKVSSVISVLRDEKYLTPDYSDRAKALFNLYHPFEIDSTLDWEFRKSKMLEWWSKHYEVLKECGLTKDDLESIVKSNRIQFRDGYRFLFEFLQQYDIPCTIITSNGLGGDIIKMVFSRDGVDCEKINVLSNNIVWDENGKFLDILKPIIHVLNKDEVIIEDEKIKLQIKDKKNVILIGDGEGDLSMTSHIEFEDIIRVGFLNEKEEESMETFKKVFDIVVINDGSLEVVNEILKVIKEGGELKIEEE
jgi:cytosolic 5'-nucleotidase 3